MPYHDQVPVSAPYNVRVFHPVSREWEYHGVQTENEGKRHAAYLRMFYPSAQIDVVKMKEG